MKLINQYKWIIILQLLIKLINSLTLADVAIVLNRSSDLHNGILFTGKMTYLDWNRAQKKSFKI